jgi:hypothetical protein
MRSLKPCNVPRHGACRRKRTSSSICRRCRLVGQRTAIINQIRCFLLEHGLTVRQQLHWLRHALPDILAQRTNVLSPRMIRLLEDLAQDWHHSMIASRP